MGFVMRGVVRDIAKGRGISMNGIPWETVLVMDKAKSYGIDIHLPMDYVTYDRVGDCDEDILPSVFEMDCGPKTQALNTDVIKASKTIIWNGPIGIYEISRFEVGTRRVMDDVIEATKRGAFTLIIGKHTTRMLHLYNSAEQVTHATSWSGPSFELLFGNELMAIAALSDEVPHICSSEQSSSMHSIHMHCPFQRPVGLHYHFLDSIYIYHFPISQSECRIAGFQFLLFCLHCLPISQVACRRSAADLPVFRSAPCKPSQSVCRRSAADRRKHLRMRPPKIPQINVPMNGDVSTCNNP